jgi:16S rRNA (cytidine1402-2'-O)-methyltransferase
MDVVASLPYAAHPPAFEEGPDYTVASNPVGRLYVVATPIGNLGDLSPRAREVLCGCALIAAEDTRHTGALLRHFGIATPLMSLHDHNERQRAPELLARLQAGAHIALVSDAGTPAISDPGYELVRAAAAAGLETVAVPGPCAAVAALSVAALPTDRFCFEGFLPARASARRARLDALGAEIRTLVFYESPHRIGEMLGDCAAALGPQRAAVIARELTKLHETLYRGTLEELRARSATDAALARGEIVVVIAGAPPAAPAAAQGELDRVLKLLLADLPLKQAAQLAAAIVRVRDNEAYRRALELRNAAPEP